MSDKKDKSYEKEFNKSEEFADKLSMSNELYNSVLDIMDKETDKVFKDAGYERIQTPTSFYANGKPYGFGVEEGKFQIRYASSTKSYIDKQIILGAKRIQSEITLSYTNGMFTLVYQTTEQDIYKHYMISEKLKMPAKSKEDIKKIEKELKPLFEKCAKKELGYLTNTKLNVEDKLQTAITPVVSINENIKNMKKLTLKELFSNEEENSVSSEENKNIEKVIDLNTQPVEGEKDKFLLFDDEDNQDDAKEIFEKYSNVGKEEFKNIFSSTLKSKFGNAKFKELTPVEKKELFNTIDNLIKSKEEATIDEITTAGPAGTGAGRYDTKSAWAPVGMLANQGKGSNKKAKTKEEVGAPYNTPANDKIYEGDDKKKFAEKVLEERKSKFNETVYAKNKSKRPKVDKDYNIIPEKKDNFYTTVKVDTSTHPLGMPFVKPGSQEEVEKTNNDYDKLKRMGIQNEEENKGALIKRKFSTLEENKKLGINKRYIITEKTSEEYEKDRWKKISDLKGFESLAKFEEDLISENIDVNDELNLNESINYSAPSIEDEMNDILNESVNSKETILVEKPSSKFGTPYKFYKEEFINESKSYILDLNTMMYVPNPNSKK